jgi:hypothetical protein
VAAPYPGSHGSATSELVKHAKSVVGKSTFQPPTRVQWLARPIRLRSRAWLGDGTCWLREPDVLGAHQRMASS